MKAPEKKTKSRPRSATIQPIKVDAPWVLISTADAMSGCSENTIRKAIPTRKFGNADYVSVVALNQWILSGLSIPAQP